VTAIPAAAAPVLPATASARWIRALRDFAGAAHTAGARCEQCGRAIGAAHEHLLDLTSRRTVCSCTWCAARTEQPSAAGGSTPLRRIPLAVTPLADFRLSDADWDGLMIPIGLAFFFVSSTEGRVVAMYPGPAGAVESLLDLEAWHSLLDHNPVLATLEADVEALLVHRIGPARQYFRAPIDRCFGLAGLIRTRWHGLSGGAAVQEAIDGFFTDLPSGSHASSEAMHA